ncbi:MAG: GcrA family cell cycle regulator [Robiginitomaculum sp.]
MAWTEERVKVLTKLWMNGLSASQVAKQLGGVTRNAVIGKVHRLGLSGRAKPSRLTKRTRKTSTTTRRRSVAKVSPRTPKQVITTPPPLEAKLMDNGEYANILSVTENMCKWPIGDPSSANFRFCGRGVSKDEPYCKAHAQLAYQPARKRGAPQRTLGYAQKRALR